MWRSAGSSPAIEKAGEMDNTLIFYIVGDNGASGEGGLEGTVNEIASLNGIQLGLAGLEAKFDEIGGPKTEPHVPVGWAWAANTPFQWTKQVASHFGGTRNPWSSIGRKAFARRAGCGASSITSLTSRPPCWKPPASRSRRSSTASNRSRSKA